MTDISASFVKHFQGDVHLAYQQMGSKLKTAVRSQTGVKGSTAVFQKVGKGLAATKTRHGDVPVMNLTHAPVECALADFYAGDWVDSLDELKINHDERRVVACAGAYALGRKTDELIISALAGATNVVGDGSDPLDKAMVMEAFSALNLADVPDDGQRFGVVSPAGWNALLALPEFSDSAYVGDELPFLKGSESRKWLGIVWIMHNGLPLAEDARSCFVFHKSAVGHASGAEVQTDITWHGDKAAYFINNMMSQGAALIDQEGVVKILAGE
ncbi:hypothetical protein FACS1894186_3200 [Alphaproteobacteria bacterium]|nr:hypothetical protein FACS1894186_3200 [Alphaproteobacteria bacterium]